MSRWSMSPGRYRAICVAALALVSVIVVSGAGVRLTGSGLGCDDWPNCNASKLVDVSSKHAAIEQINRLFTGLVSVGVILAVLGSVIRSPRRRDLTWLSWGLVLGVIGQIVLGGITVLVDLHPAAVQSHFVLSMVLVANGVVLVRRSAEPDGDGPIPARRARVVSEPIRRHVLALGVVTAIAICLGTVVTGAGPHAGDEAARRFGLSISTAARIHSVAVWVSVAVAVALFWRLLRRPDDRKRLDGLLTSWVCVAVLQGAIGYLQYFTGVPALLVAVHVAGATALWIVTVWLCAVTTSRRPEPITSSNSSSNSSSVAEPADELDALVDRRGEEAADGAEGVGSRGGAAGGI